MGIKVTQRPPKPGLISQLSKRVRFLCQLVKLVPKEKFKVLVDGIFMTKLLYCLQLFGNVWGIETTGEIEPRQNLFTKANLRSLQVLQNKVIRLMTGCWYNTHTEELFICQPISIFTSKLLYGYGHTVYRPWSNY